MQSRWSDEDAAAFVARYASRWGEDLALRTYTSRLLGGDDRLVLHGGGNTSAKGTFTNRLGETIPALYVKASGHDLATLEPDGLPGVDLGYLRKLRALPALDDAGRQGRPQDRDAVSRDGARAPPPRGARAARRPRGADGRRGSAAPPRRRGAARHARGARIRRPRGEPRAGPHAAAHVRSPHPDEGVPALDRAASLRRAGAPRDAAAGSRRGLLGGVPGLPQAPCRPPAPRTRSLRRPAARGAPPRPRRALHRRRRPGRHRRARHPGARARRRGERHA